MEINEFAIQYERLCNAFGIEVKKGQFKVYYEFLNRFHIKAIEYAVNQCIMNGDYFPKIKDLSDICRAYRIPISPDKRLKGVDETPVPMPEITRQILDAIKIKTIE